MRRTAAFAALAALAAQECLVESARADPAAAPIVASAPNPPSPDEIVMPVAHDPMLTPMPPAPHEIGSWSDALRMIRERSTQLHIAEGQLVQARGQRREAVAVALPKLTSSGSLNHYLLVTHTPQQTITYQGTAIVIPPGVRPDPTTFVNASIDVDQPLLNLGGWYGIGTAKERERGAELTEKDTERQLLATVAQAAVGVITASSIADSSRVSLASAISTFDLTRRRAALGAASAVDVLRADQEVSTSRAQVVSADESLREARETLGMALGDPSQWGVASTVRVDELERTAGSVCKAVDDIETRTDVRAATKGLLAAERDRHAVDYTYVPTIDATSSLSYTNAPLYSANGEHVNWTVGASATWTLYDGGDRYGKRQVTEGAATVAREQLTQTKRAAVLQVVQADRAVLVAQANLEVSTRARDIAKESARLSRIAFVNGSGTSFDLVESEQRLRTGEIDLLIKNFGVFQARIAAFLARANCAI